MEMNYIKFGNGDKTMVILPGLSITPVCDSPDAVIKAYAVFNNDFTVYLFDRRSDVDEGYTLEQMADDTVTKMKELGLKDIYLFGVSQGGMISQYIALKYPEMIKKMVLASTTSRFTDSGSELWNELCTEKKPVKLAKQFCKKIYSKSFYRKIALVLPMMYRNISEEQLKKFEIYARSCIGFDISGRISSIDMPVLVLGSKVDMLIPYEEMIYLHENIKGSEIYLYDDYSHAVYDEAGDFKDRIMEFFLK